MYSMELIIWVKTGSSKFEEIQAKAIAAATKTKYFKGYIQYSKGEAVFTIPSKGTALDKNNRRITFETGDKQLAEQVISLSMKNEA